MPRGQGNLKEIGREAVPRFGRVLALRAVHRIALVVAAAECMQYDAKHSAEHHERGKDADVVSGLMQFAVADRRKLRALTRAMDLRCFSFLLVTMDMMPAPVSSHHQQATQWHQARPMQT